nr:immunoglobulin heavy chain junction region [Mus musculus]
CARKGVVEYAMDYW